MRNSLILGFALVGLSSLGCGGSSTGAFVNGQCGTFTPCGGAIVGTWRLTGTCYSYPDAGVSNSDAGTSPCSIQQSTSNTQINGTISFKTDGTYSVATSMGGSASFTYPASCLTAMAMTCAQLNSSLAAEGTTDAGISGSCSSASSGGCTCTETFKGQASSETGSYTTSGSSLTMVSTSSTSTQDPTTYCVQGTKLTIHITSASSGTSVSVTATR